MQVHSKTACDSFVLDGEGRCYEVYVSVPATYANRPDARYPVLYVLDGNWLFGSACDAVRLTSIPRVLYPNSEQFGHGAPEMIVVSIGYPGNDAEAIVREAQVRRIFDYTAGPVASSVLDQLGLEGSIKYGGAVAFARLIAGAVRTRIEERYRVDSSTRVLFGGSGAGAFGAFVLLSDPEAFTHYIIASPAVGLCGDHLFEQEAAYAATHDDLPASVFLSFGSRELGDMAVASIASGTARFFETLL